MQKEEIINLIEAIVKSLKENPSQFNFEVHVEATGMRASAGPGGIGAIGQSFGGGTGIQATASIGDAEVNIANKVADDQIQKEISNAVDKLEELKSELSKPTLNKLSVKSVLDEFRVSKILSGVISAILGFLVTKYIGI